jgi:hypothetical protein
MLKKTSDRAARTGGSQRSNGSYRLFRVIDVKSHGIVAELVDGKSSGRVFLEATPQFVAQKDVAPNFKAKSTDGKMHPRFYDALMRPTDNPTHQLRKGVDVISAKIYDRSGTVTVDGYGELAKAALGGGFNVFARGDSVKKDPFDDSVERPQPGDEIVQGLGRFVKDPEANNGQGSVWVEIVSEKGNPSSLDALFEEMRNVASKTRGANLFIRILNEDGTNNAQTSVYPGKQMTEVESEIGEIRSLNLNPEQVATWEIHPRIYLNDSFTEAGGTAKRSKLENVFGDMKMGLGIDLDATPVMSDAVTRTRDGRSRRAAGDSFAVPIAVSLTLYANDKTEQKFVPGAVRAIVPMGSTVVHSRQLYMTPAQRQLAASTNAPAADDHAPTAQDAPEQSSAKPAAAGGEDLDFGFGANQ